MEITYSNLDNKVRPLEKLMELDILASEKNIKKHVNESDIRSYIRKYDLRYHNYYDMDLLTQVFIYAKNYGFENDLEKMIFSRFYVQFYLREQFNERNFGINVNSSIYDLSLYITEKDKKIKMLDLLLPLDSSKMELTFFVDPVNDSEIIKTERELSKIENILRRKSLRKIDADSYMTREFGGNNQLILDYDSERFKLNDLYKQLYEDNENKDIILLRQNLVNDYFKRLNCDEAYAELDRANMTEEKVLVKNYPVFNINTKFNTNIINK